MTEEQKAHLIEEYISSSRTENGLMILGVLGASMVFVIPFLIVMMNGWWGPLGGVKHAGGWITWSIVLICMVYVALIIDRVYRKH